MATGVPHHLYVVKFSDGVVKVGYTGNLKARLRAHRTDARSRGARATHYWASEEYGRQLAQQGERALIAWCAERWPRAWGSEYFAGADAQAIALYAADVEDELFAAEYAMCRAEQKGDPQVA